ncbi:hypothetical protein TREES_T100017527 [Tupaia chinensis]|uniref:Uncharacterized protein n=1 Tax=Tupaia chinensis TaxID=246437 RepID=L9LCU6_TUPCH|nr:hypothetical protein TREES_T100017527 [Tupaia chinensis]
MWKSDREDTLLSHGRNEDNDGILKALDPEDIWPLPSCPRCSFTAVLSSRPPVAQGCPYTKIPPAGERHLFHLEQIGHTNLPPLTQTLKRLLLLVRLKFFPPSTRICVPGSRPPFTDARLPVVSPSYAGAFGSLVTPPTSAPTGPHMLVHVGWAEITSIFRLLTDTHCSPALGYVLVLLGIPGVDTPSKTGNATAVTSRNSNKNNGVS